MFPNTFGSSLLVTAMSPRFKDEDKGKQDRDGVKDKKTSEIVDIFRFSCPVLNAQENN